MPSASEPTGVFNARNAHQLRRARHNDAVKKDSYVSSGSDICRPLLTITQWNAVEHTLLSISPTLLSREKLPGTLRTQMWWVKHTLLAICGIRVPAVIYDRS